MAKGIPRPVNSLWKFFHETTLYDFILGIVAVIGTAGLGQRLIKDNETGWGVFSLIASLVSLVALCVKTWIRFKQDKEYRSPNDLEGCLTPLYNLLNFVHEGTDPKLRITIHIPIKDKEGSESLEQLLDYVGDQRKPNTKGRVFPVGSGIIGKLYRECSATSDHRYLHSQRKHENHEQYINELVNDWGYTDQEARKRDPSSMSWMAVPLSEGGNEKQILAIVYLDSVLGDFFDEVKQYLVLGSSIGIAKYIEKRYSK